MDATQGIVVFICGPFRAETEYKRRLNIIEAERVALQLAQAGIYYICPHLNSIHFQGEGEDSFWLDMYKHILTRCDAVILLPAWRASAGSVAEKILANSLCIPTYTEKEFKDALSKGTLTKRQTQASRKEQDDTDNACWQCKYYQSCKSSRCDYSGVPSCFVPLAERAGSTSGDISVHLPYSTC